jgi:four helix bundle protein
MRDLRKLDVAVVARQLALAVYESTGRFPAHERYALAAQMRRAGVSIVSNIAEGTGRGSDREFLRFLYIALGSATELAVQLDLAITLGFIDGGDGAILIDRTNHVLRMLNRLTASMRQKPGNARRGPAPSQFV